MSNELTPGTLVRYTHDDPVHGEVGVVVTREEAAENGYEPMPDSVIVRFPTSDLLGDDGSFDSGVEGCWVRVDATPAVADEDETPDVNVALLDVAATHERVVEFRYAKGDGSVLEERRLFVTDVSETRKGHTLAVGYDPDRDDPRAYRVDRIKGVVRVL